MGAAQAQGKRRMTAVNAPLSFMRVVSGQPMYRNQPRKVTAMPELHDAFMTPSKPTADRPLLGQTVLIVEDSRFASEAVRLMCLRCGARIRRADTLASAARHLKVYCPTVAIIDLGLPDGSGHDLIHELAQARPRVPVLLATSGDPTAGPAACAAGADAFLAKPLDSLGAFLETILSRLPRDTLPRGPRAVLNDAVHPDRMALRDDLSHVMTLLDGRNSLNGPGQLTYVSGFLSGLGRSMGDADLTGAAEELHAMNRDGISVVAQVSRISAMVQARIGPAGSAPF
jgi:ActR/RegA family two-component response regulator